MDYLLSSTFHTETERFWDLPALQRRRQPLTVTPRMTDSIGNDSQLLVEWPSYETPSDVGGKLQMSGTAHLILASRAEGGAKTVHLCLLAVTHARTRVPGAGRAPFTHQHFPANSSHKQRVTTPDGPALTRPLRMCWLTVFWQSKRQHFSQITFC